ncbi:MAG: hypothetical protein OEV78_12765 [Spirochaetia bacterium]|nr:hypothetical protein [Spirochaetia bacterium]
MRRKRENEILIELTLAQKNYIDILQKEIAKNFMFLTAHGINQDKNTIDAAIECRRKIKHYEDILDDDD